MDLIVEVTSDEPARPLSKLLTISLGLDIWEATADRLVLRAGEPQVDRIAKMGYQVRQIVPVQEHLSTFAVASAQEGYHSATSLEEDMRQLAETRPDLAVLHEIGRSVEGRPIWGLQIGERRGDRRKLLFMGCHHAREWIAVEVPFQLARELIENADAPEMSARLTQGEIWIVPMVNPDGHEFSRTENRLWRKNRRRNADGSFGVDPNRNYGYMWGVLDVPTSSHVPSDETYVGPRAFSEPETQAMRDLIATQKFAGLITYHSFSQLVLYPWGYTAEEVRDPVDRATLRDLALGMSECICQVHGKVYTPQPSSRLYPTAGDTTDWTYGEYGIPSFTIELRPETVEEGGFILPASAIRPTWEENRPAAFHLIDRLLGISAHAVAAA
jgi:carboxypeptidase T